jgi:hypothetical protein
LRTDRKSLTITVDLEPGKVYEVSYPDEEERYFIEVRRGELRRLSQASVRGHFADLEENLAYERRQELFAALFAGGGGWAYDEIDDL